MDAKDWMREALLRGPFALHNEVSADELARAAGAALRLPMRDARNLRTAAAELIAQLRVRPESLSNEESPCRPRKRSKRPGR